MESVVPVVANQVVVMFLIMALGFVLYRVRFLNRAGVSQLSDIVLYVANPAIVFTSLLRNYDPSLLVNAGYAILAAALALGASILLANLVFRDRARRLGMVSRFAVIYSNSSFIGLPLAQATLGPDCVFYMSAANLVLTVLLWTHGVWLMSGDKGEIAPKKVLTNPIILALLAGLVCFFLSWQPPEVVTQAIDSLGSLNTGLVMLVLGAYLGMCDLRRVLRDARIYAVSALRLVVVPLITMAILVLLPNVDTNVALTVLVFESCPVGALASLFSHKYANGGEDYGTGLVALSTVFSLATIPLVLTIASAVLG